MKNLTEEQKSHIVFTIIPIYVKQMEEDARVATEEGHSRLAAQFEKQKAEALEISKVLQDDE